MRKGTPACCCVVYLFHQIRASSPCCKLVVVCLQTCVCFTAVNVGGSTRTRVSSLDISLVLTGKPVSYVSSQPLGQHSRLFGSTSYKDMVFHIIAVTIVDRRLKYLWLVSHIVRAFSGHWRCPVDLIVYSWLPTQVQNCVLRNPYVKTTGRRVVY